jgi:predicted nucleotide-binding protein
MEAVPPKGQLAMADCAPMRDIFIVHGHDTGTEEEVRLVIERLGLRAIILHEQADTGKTLIEKVERNADVGFAVVILTPDDVGSSKNTRPQPPPRTRRNVVLDLYYFLGKLGHTRVYALLKDRAEIPPEIADVPCTTMDSTGRWQNNLAKALRAAGMELDTIM